MRSKLSEWSLIYFFGGANLCLVAYCYRLIDPDWSAIRACVLGWFAGG